MNGIGIAFTVVFALLAITLFHMALQDRRHQPFVFGVLCFVLAVVSLGWGIGIRY